MLAHLALPRTAAIIKCRCGCPTSERDAMAPDPADYKRQTMYAYDGLAAEVVPGFDQFFETYGRLEADHFLTHLDPGDVILDLGCGPGSASRYFAGKGYTPVSADLSEAMVRECKRRRLDNRHYRE
jgi:2-polyprenyl-3-methyl-5-hydroxy-6-metoxy-1,4-benzoquinol methylase